MKGLGGTVGAGESDRLVAAEESAHHAFVAPAQPTAALFLAHVVGVSDPRAHPRRPREEAHVPAGVAGVAVHDVRLMVMKQREEAEGEDQPGSAEGTTHDLATELPDLGFVRSWMLRKRTEDEPDLGPIDVPQHAKQPGFRSAAVEASHDMKNRHGARRVRRLRPEARSVPRNHGCAPPGPRGGRALRGVPRRWLWPVSRRCRSCGAS